MGFHKILCPVDFSAGSREALRVAAGLARESGAALVLTHIWQAPLVGEFQFAPLSIKNIVESEQAELTTWIGLAKELGAPNVDARFLTGAPWDQIVKIAHDEPDLDLIVMGTHGRTGIKHVLLGSVAEKVVRHAPCTVLVVRAESAKA
ncbi:MAG TPA: universal stress protein [Kofleriaceae bacterium]|nr:universal stress protein [Kofleriaceae bacterium]